MAKRKSFLALAAAAALVGCGGEKGGDESNVAVAGNVAAPAVGAEAAPEATIAQALAGAADHATLVGALRAAGLEATLAGPGPYTVFAPTNAGFEKLPAGTAESLMQPEQKARLTSILTYHVVPGVVTAADLARAVEAAGGKAVLATLGGGNVTISGREGGLLVTDAGGGQARLIRPDGLQSNGIVHGIDAVLMPPQAGQTPSN
jgi:uncharacterized surface protein with fasciclin (FAS1) repeats